MVKAGDSVPNIDLVEGSPGNKVNLSKELGSGLIIGVPAAFSKCLSLLLSSPPWNRVWQLHSSSAIAASPVLTGFAGPTCSDSHIPGYIANPKLKDAGKVFVVSVNDAFV
jgi:2-Cys peroxiredoxin 5